MNEHPVARSNERAVEAWQDEIRQLALAALRQDERTAQFTGRRLKAASHE